MRKTFKRFMVVLAIVAVVMGGVFYANTVDPDDPTDPFGVITITNVLK